MSARKKHRRRKWIGWMAAILVLAAAALGGTWLARNGFASSENGEDGPRFVADGMRHMSFHQLEEDASDGNTPSGDMLSQLEQAKQALQEKIDRERDSSQESEAPPEESEPQESRQAPHEGDSRPAPAAQLTGLVIGIDPGHQSKGDSTKEPSAPGSSVMKASVASGTTGRFSKVPEYKVTLAVGLLLRDLLKDAGATVVMTRESSDVNISNSQRAIMLNDAKVDLAVRIHCDGADNSDVHGASMLVPTGEYTTDIEDASYRAGKTVMNSYCEVTGAKNRGLFKRDDQSGFNWSTVPVITIEMGFMSNESEDWKLVSEDYQKLCAQGLFEGIAQWYEGR